VKEVKGTNTTSDVGVYEITVTLEEGYRWSEDTTDDTTEKTFKWGIEKKVLMVEGASSAEVSKTYDTTTSIEPQQIDAKDFFIHGLISGQEPNVTAGNDIAGYPVYKDKNAGTNKTVYVSSITLTDNGSFKVKNYDFSAANLSDCTIDVGVGSITVTKTTSSTSLFNIWGAKVKIDPCTIAADIEAIDNYVFTGNPITPEPVVSGLTKDKDYTLEYSNNINAGTATVKVIGKGNYTGTLSRDFTIN